VRGMQTLAVPSQKFLILLSRSGELGSSIPCVPVKVQAPFSTLIFDSHAAAACAFDDLDLHAFA
jgi:hypothetical protein